jgi:hypothetical protein
MEEQILAVDLSTEQTLEVNLPEQDNVAQIDVYWQDEVVLDLDASLMYIVSGQQEIQDYVDNKSKPEIDEYIQDYAKPIVAEVVDQIATPVIDEYFENTVKPSITEFAENEMAGYAQTAKEQADRAEATANTVTQTVEEFNTQTEATKNEFIAFVNDKTVQLEEVASNAATEATDGAEHSRIWAEGEQAEVKELGGELSSMGAADLAYAIANAPEDTPIDASGLFALDVIKGPKGDKGDKGEDGKDGVDGKSVFDGYATNCITEIPQDIKLELNDGVLTLKAGSKVYVPNGFEADGVTPKFDVVVIESDVITTSSSARPCLYFFNPDSGAIERFGAAVCTSGATAPNNSQYLMWYDTTNNLIKKSSDYGSTWIAEVSLPIGVFTETVSGIASIDQTFNGFGYIGSTVFALPGVKGLIPNGRNEDGSLNNIEFTVDNVWLGQTAYNTNKATLGVVSDMKALVYVTDKNVVYDESRNKNKLVSNGNYWQGCFAGDVSVSDMKFTSLTPKLPFRAVDRNDSSWLSGLGMPSGKYINLTIGASGSTYIAPANGFFFCKGNSTASNQDVWADTDNFFYSAGHSASSGNGLSCFFPVRKGQHVAIKYTCNMIFIHFIYTEGEN